MAAKALEAQLASELKSRLCNERSGVLNFILPRVNEQPTKGRHFFTFVADIGEPHLVLHIDCSTTDYTYISNTWDNDYFYSIFLS